MRPRYKWFDLSNDVVTRRGRGRIIFPDLENPMYHLELVVELWEDLSTIQIAFALTAGACPDLVEGNGRLVRQ